MELSKSVIFRLSKPVPPLLLPPRPQGQPPCANGPIAQLVEQRIENPRVPGSNPGRATTAGFGGGFTRRQ